MQNTDTDDNPSATSAPLAPERATFIKPPWGLTYAIPEGVTLAWGARAIYGWREVTKPVTTVSGRIKISRGRRLTTTTCEPSIDLLSDRMGWASCGEVTDEYKARMFMMGAWIDNTGIPAIKAACRKARIQPSDDGPGARVEHTSDGYTIVANPNGSHGYLYIAAWKVVS